MLSFDECGPLLRIVWRDPTVLNDWHTAADLSDEMTHIVSVGVRTGETPDTIFLTREVCADGELRGTNAIPKPLIVHQDRLRALTEGEKPDEHERLAKLDEEREEQERYRRDTDEPPVTDMQGRDIPHRDCGPTGKMQSNKGE